MIDTKPLQAIPIKDIWADLGHELPRGNSNARCFGPAHKNGDKHPSLGLDTKTNRYKCFACEQQGDGIGLVMASMGLDFKQATEWLSGKYGVGLSHFKSETDTKYITHGKTPVVAPREYTQEPIRNANFSYAKPDNLPIWQAFYNYCNKPNDELIKWWQARGLSNELLELAGWRSISKTTYQKLAKDYKPSELIEAGILSQYDGQIKPLFYNHRVAVPYFDGDQLIYLRARSLDPKAKAKYLAPRNSSPPIYNYQAIETYDGKEPLYITESETDALALTDMGKTALALVGGQKNPASLTVRELTHLVTYGLSPAIKIKIVTDRDTTGQTFFDNVAKALYIAGVASDNLERYQSDPKYKDISEQLQNERLNK